MFNTFNTLNRFISRLDGQPQDQSTQGACGFQVLQNNNKSLDLEPWFDFIIGINGRTLDNSDPNLFSTEIRNCAGKTIGLGVWTAKGSRIREIQTSIPSESPSLGVSLQWSLLSSANDVWHVLDVAPNSPAEKAGILPYSDYIIGSPQNAIKGESGLPDLVENYLDTSLTLFVYNHEYNVTRPVEIIPSRSWGGLGSLGCTLGYGALHKIPAPLIEPPNAPGETMFDTSINEKQDSGNFTSINEPGNFVSLAELQPQSSSLPAYATPSRSKKEKKRNPNISSAVEIDEYFNEEEEKSRQQDHAPTQKGSGVTPPPPPPPKISKT